MTDLGVMKTKARCVDQMMSRSPPAGRHVCQKHLFYLLRGNPAVNARATQKQLTLLTAVATRHAHVLQM